MTMIDTARTFTARRPGLGRRLLGALLAADARHRERARLAAHEDARLADMGIRRENIGKLYR